jgi:sulfatase maturation enzyme AslB (radical SAM superfamily)
VTEFFPGLRALRAQDPEYLRRCARCFLAGICDQCPSKSWAEHGTLDTPVDYFCEVTQARARFIGLLRDGELPWDVIDGKERVKWLK